MRETLGQVVGSINFRTGYGGPNLLNRGSGEVGNGCILQLMVGQHILNVMVIYHEMVTNITFFNLLFMFVGHFGEALVTS